MKTKCSEKYLGHAGMKSVSNLGYYTMRNLMSEIKEVTMGSTCGSNGKNKKNIDNSGGKLYGRLRSCLKDNIMMDHREIDRL
jgi:hypothetical protein